MLRKIFSFDTFFRVTSGLICTVALLDSTTIVLRVNDNSMRGYSKGDYILGLKMLSLDEGDLAVIVDPFDNREKIRRVVATESKIVANSHGRRERRSLLVPTCHWWCESDIPSSDTGAIDSCAVHKHLIRAKVVLKIPTASYS